MKSSLPPRFESVFPRDGVTDEGTPRFRIRGSGVHEDPESAPLTQRIVDHLEANGINVTRRSWGSPGNADSHHLDGPFLDGGLQAKTGNYWMEPRGAWIGGEEAVTWLAHGLGLMPPASQPRHRIPALPEALRNAYAATDFVVLVEPEIHVDIGMQPPQALLDRMTAQESDYAAIVTAWNPFSRALVDGDNRLRQKQLLHELHALGLDTLPAEGRDCQGQWPAEDSVLVFGLTLTHAESLLAKYQQHALVWITDDMPTQLMFHPR